MKWGQNPGAKGTFIVNNTTLAELPKNQAATNFDTIALDFEHNSVPESPTYRGEPVKVAAHGVPEVVAGQGLFLNNIQWTPEGREHVGNGHYKDLSPSILHNAKGEVLFIHSAAACRQGALVGGSINLTADSPILKLTNSNDPMREQLLKLLTAAGVTIPADATDEQLTALATEAEGKLKTLSAAPADKAAKAKPEDAAGIEGLRSEVGALKTTLTTLSTTLASLQAGNESAQVNLILNSAAAEGKVVPKEFIEGDQKVTPAQLKLLVAALPVTVPVGDRRTPHTTPAAGSALVLNSAADQVRKQLGLTEDEWKAIK